MSLQNRCLLTLLTIAVAFQHPSAAQDISVRLLDSTSPRQVAISGVGGDVRLFAGDFADPLMTMTPDEVAIVSRASNQLHVKIGEMKLYAKSLRIEPSSGAAFRVAVREGSRLDDGRTYPGRLHVSPNSGGWELRLVNEVDLETYVACVIASEYGLDDLEGSKAMAVVARTYALAAVNESEPDELLDDHTLSQVYRGLEGVTDLAMQAAQETSGEVVTHNGVPIEAVYFSSSGGRTANNEDVWDAAPLPYLRGKTDPYDSSSPHSRWTARLSRSELLQRLSEVTELRVDGFLVGDRSEDGRVATVELLHDDGRRREMTANAFRLAVIAQFGARSLRSTLFDVRREGDDYVFEGRGYGHGVGLSQWGAHEMAKRGSTYRDILGYYYSDVDVGSFDGTATDASPEPSVASRPESPRRPAPERIGW